MSFLKKHGPAAAIGFVAGFAVGGLTSAGAQVKQLLFGPGKPKGQDASNVVSTKVG